MDGVQLELQNKIEEHIGDNLDQMTGVKQDIVSLLKEMEERIRITREIRYRLGSLTRTVSTDLGEKMKKLTNNVDVMQSDLKANKVSVESNVTNVAGQLKNHLSSLEMIRSNLKELTVNTSTIQTAIGNIKTTADINNGRLRVQVSKLGDLKATVYDMNLRVALSACAASDTIIRGRSTIKFADIKTIKGITNQHLTPFKSSGIFVCEVPGLYHISVVVYSYTDSANFKISKSSQELIIGLTNDYYSAHRKFRHSTAAILAIELQKGDFIDIKAAYEDMYIFGRSKSCLTIVKVK